MQPNQLITLLALVQDAIAALPEGDPNRNEELFTAASGAATRVQVARPVHIPSFAGNDPAVFESFKTEVVLFDDPSRGTIKINFWSGADPRETPHNHPWEDADGIAFRSHIIRGGYTEVVTQPDGTVFERTYREGDINTVRTEDFHTVHSVLPDTVTLMICSPRREVVEGVPRWGYRLGDGEYVDMNHPEVGDPTFFARFTLLNPFRRPPAMWANGLPASLLPAPEIESTRLAG